MQGYLDNWQNLMFGNLVLIFGLLETVELVCNYLIVIGLSSSPKESLSRLYQLHQGIEAGGHNMLLLIICKAGAAVVHAERR